MNEKYIFRMFLLCPVLILISFILISLNYPSEDWPNSALNYVEWWKTQSRSEMALVLNRVYLCAELALVLSTIGLFFIKSIRYVYLVSVLILVVAEYQYLPILIGGWHPVLDNIANLFMGINCVLLFTVPYENYAFRKIPC